VKSVEDSCRADDGDAGVAADSLSPSWPSLGERIRESVDEPPALRRRDELPQEIRVFSSWAARRGVAASCRLVVAVMTSLDDPV